MAQGHRPDRVGDQIRQELSELLSRGEVHDPGIGFITLTRVQVTVLHSTAATHPDRSSSVLLLTVTVPDRSERSNGTYHFDIEGSSQVTTTVTP